MKKENLPQDESCLKKNNLSEILYILDEKEQYTQANSTGWEVKSIALNQTLNLIEENINHALKLISEGKASPILYFMEKSRMDISILARYMNLWQWQVKRHLKPQIFNKLKPKTIEKYASVFRITPEDLIHFKIKE